MRIDDVPTNIISEISIEHEHNHRYNTRNYIYDITDTYSLSRLACGVNVSAITVVGS